MIFFNKNGSVVHNIHFNLGVFFLILQLTLAYTALAYPAPSLTGTLARVRATFSASLSGPRLSGTLANRPFYECTKGAG